MTNPPGAMPPLPEPTYIYHLNPSTGEDDLFEFASSGAVDEGCKYCKRLYTDDQLQAYAAPLIARVAELEAERAKLRDAVEDAADEYRRYIVEDTAPCNLSIYMMDAFDAAIAAKD